MGGGPACWRHGPDVVNSPVRMSRTPPKVDRTSPALGEHTRELLETGEPEMEKLVGEGVIQA